MKISGSLWRCLGIGALTLGPLVAACSTTNSTAMLPSAAARKAPRASSTSQAPDYSYFYLWVPKIHVTSLQTTLTVPPKPPGYGTIYLWPGLDNVEALDAKNDFLQQPLLNWGGVCTYPSLPRYSSWLAEAFYYDQVEADKGEHEGCNGGKVISGNPSDELTETMTLKGKTWYQTISDKQTGRSSHFVYSARSLDDQYPDRITFAIEIWDVNGFNNHVPAVTFKNTTFTASTAFPQCTLTSLVSPSSDTTTGKNSTSAPVSSNGGKTCSYARITLYPVSKFIEPNGEHRYPAHAPPLP